MEETATICLQATKNSLVILDEVGRGTSTFDGIALAQAIIEYIFQNVKAKCLFATHYHELTQLEKRFVGIINYHMLSRKSGNRIIFLHKIAKGVSGSSFGLEVAKLAQLPNQVIKRAAEILKNMQYDASLINANKCIASGQTQTKLFTEFTENEDVDELKDKINFLQEELDQKDLIINQFKNINLNEITPKQAFDLLWKLKIKEENLF